MSKAIGDGESLTDSQAGAKFKDIFSFDNLAETIKQDDKFQMEFIQDQVSDAKQENNAQKYQILELQTTLKETEMTFLATLKKHEAQMNTYEEQARKHEELARQQAYQLDQLQQKVAQLSSRK